MVDFEKYQQNEYHHIAEAHFKTIEAILPIRFAPILALVGVGVNRIGKVYSMVRV